MMISNWSGNTGYGRGCCLWLVLAIGLVVMTKEADSLTEVQKTQITKGLKAGEAISNLVQTKKFKEALPKIASSVSTYLGALGPFLGVILAFIPSWQSAELTFMIYMMKKIDARFIVMDSQFNDIERLINWNAVKVVNFGQIVQKILAMGIEYRFMYELPTTFTYTYAVQNRTTIFISHYDSDYQDSGTKLYQAVRKLDNLVMRFTKNNRKETQVFLLGVMQLLLQAAKIELAYLQVKKLDANAMAMQTQWEKRLDDVTYDFEGIDRAVKNKYHDQSEVDLLEFAAKYTSLKNIDFAIKFYNFVIGKYYWRDWVVMVYNDITGYDKHFVHTCGGHIKFQQNGRNIVIGSVDKASKGIDLAAAGREISRVPVSKVQYTVRFDRIKKYSVALDAVEVYKSLNKLNACQVAVVKCNNDAWYKWSGRFVWVGRCPYYYINMFG